MTSRITVRGDRCDGISNACADVPRWPLNNDVEPKSETSSTADALSVNCSNLVTIALLRADLATSSLVMEKID